MTILISALLVSSSSLAESPSDEASRLIETLRSSDALVQPEIVRDIEAMGEAVVPSLVDAMNAGDTLLRYQAIEILGRIGEDANAATPQLIDALDDPESQIRRNAAWALGRVGDEASDAMPTLLDTALDVRWDVRADAVWAMGRVVEDSGDWAAVDSDLVAAVTDFLNDNSHHVRWSAAWSLARFGPGAEAALQELVDALEDEHAKVRASAAAALGRVGSSHHEELVSEALSKAMNDESALVRSRAAAALRSIRARTVPSM
ncbi:MAG: HEAT repeat domain-containing protein [Geminicoccaceae bacterium]